MNLSLLSRGQYFEALSGVLQPPGPRHPSGFIRLCETVWVALLALWKLPNQFTRRSPMQEKMLDRQFGQWKAFDERPIWAVCRRENRMLFGAPRAEPENPARKRKHGVLVREPIPHKPGRKHDQSNRGREWNMAYHAR
jgi:hypothetical protein